MGRIIGHLDLDYFYAQVEEVEKPSLREIPVVVCVFSGRTEDSGVVSTANYKAREYGVRSAMPISLAKRRLKDVEAVFVPMKHEKYETYSDRVMEILRNEVDTMEQTGIDEAFFDVTRRTGGDYGAATTLAIQIKELIREREKLTCSIGLAPSKVVAKIASDFKKPDGLTVVRDTQVASFLSPLPIDKIYGVGPKTAKILEESGLMTIGQLASASFDTLSDLLGKKSAVYLRNASRGSDDEPIVDRERTSQLSRIVTLKRDTNDSESVMEQILPALQDLHEKLVAGKRFCRNISAIGVLRDLSIHTRSKTLDMPTSDYAVLEKHSQDLFLELVRVGELRRAGVRLTGLEEMVDQHSLTEFTG